MKAFLLFFCYLLLPAGNSVSEYVKNGSAEGYIFNKYYTSAYATADTSLRFTPTQTDVILGEQLLQRQIRQYMTKEKPTGQMNDCVFIDNNLPMYLRQYVGFLNRKKEKELWINCAWKKMCDTTYASREIYKVRGGGRYYWNIRVNLVTQTLYDMQINSDR